MAEFEVQALSPNKEKEQQDTKEVNTVHNSHGRFKRNTRIAFALAGFIAVLGIILLIVGVVLITKSKRNEGKSEQSGRDETDAATDECTFSVEAQNSGLPEFFKKVDTLYYELHPYNVGSMTGVPLEFMKELFQPYNPTPQSIKAITERSRSLWEELNEMKIDKARLTAREQRMIAKTDHFLKHFFGLPYENDYFSGYWMLGPGRYCQRTFKGITTIKKQLATLFLLFRPKTAADLDRVFNLLVNFKTGINQFSENLRDGIKTGMIGSVNECKEGGMCLEGVYPEIAEKKSGEGIREWFSTNPTDPLNIEKFLSEMSPGETATFTTRFGKNSSTILEERLVVNIGTPFVDLFEFLQNEHLVHCVPSNVSSGLGTRPLEYVYNNGTRTSERTNQTLRSGDGIMSGKEAYRHFLSYSTTQNITADEVYDMGWSMLRNLYRQAVGIAKEVTGKQTESEAVTEFRKILNSPSLYINHQSFPENESNEEAFRKCKSVAEAQLYCPVRYKAALQWKEKSRAAVAQIRSKLTSLFYFTGNKTTEPTCPITMVIYFNPLRSVQGYSKGTPTCSKPSKFYIPFFVDRMGPKVMEFTVCAHEASPGHHTQSQGYQENFRDQCSNDGMDFIFLRLESSTPFREGWALYAENPLVTHDTDLYQDKPLERYGAIKSQIWRALRLIIDTGLHHKNMTRDQALDLFDRFMWDDSDVVSNEVSRYQAWPGQATAYMTGQLAIWRMRNETLAKLGNKFQLQDFHYRVLLNGEVPISFLQSYIKKYADCVLSENSGGCSDTLRPIKTQVNQEKNSPGHNYLHDEFREKLESLSPEIIYDF